MEAIAPDSPPVTGTRPTSGTASIGRPRLRVPLHPFLFAAYPVLFLYAGNVGEVSLGDVIAPLLFIEAVTAVVLVLLSLAFRDARRAGIVVSVSLIAILMYGQATWVVGRLRIHSLGRIVEDTPGLLLVAAAIIVSIVVAWRIRGRLGSLTTVLDVVAGVLVLVTLVDVVPDVVSGIEPPAVMTDRLPVVAHGPGTDRDIYYIVLDRYGSERSIASLYGITDNDLYQWLEDRGFRVLPDAHANYVSTTLSLSSVLNMEFLETLIPQSGPKPSDFQNVFELLQDHRVGRFLKSQGYEYVHIGGWFEHTRSARIADENLHPNVLSDFAAALFDMSALPLLSKATGVSFTSVDRDRHAEAALFEFDALERVRDLPGPTFTFAHILMPHPPYVFTEDGTFVDGSTPGERASYATQVKYTNARLKAILEPLLALPEEERPIIIVQADEGPYPERNGELRASRWTDATGEELEEKFGILDAFYLPGLSGEQATMPSTMSSVNTWRWVLRMYFGADLPQLPDRSWVSDKAKPYDMTEITDRIPSLHDQALAPASPPPASPPPA